MPTQVQFRRGNTSQNDAFTGASGEITIDTTLNTIRIHDGNTAGGFQVSGGGGGGGDFNTAISSATGYAITDVMSNVYVASSTAGYRYIVRSIHVTNIDGENEAKVTGQILGSNYANNITFANTIPVPAGSAVELLKKPKVLQPSNYIQMMANANSDLHVTVTIEPSTGEKYFGAGIDLTSANTYTDLYTMTADSVIESILLSNDAVGSDVKTRVVWTDGSDNINGYYAYDLVVPVQATVEILEAPKFVESGYKVRVNASVANRLEAIIAGKTV